MKIGDLPDALSQAQTGDLMQHTNPLNNLYTGHTMVFLDQSFGIIHYVAGTYTTATKVSGPVSQTYQPWFLINLLHHPKYLDFWAPFVMGRVSN